MCSALSAALAVAGAAHRAMHYVSSRRRSRAALLVPSRLAPAVPLPLPLVTETTRRAAVAGAGERSSWSSGGVFGRRPTPSPRLPLLRVCCGGDVTGRAECGLQPSARALRHGHNSPTPSRSGRRPHVAARSASAGGWPPSQTAQRQTHPDHTRADACPEPTDAVGVVEAARTEPKAAREGEGSVRTTKPAPSIYPHATALGKFERRDKTRTFCLRALGRPTPKGGSIGFGYWL